MAKIHHVPDWQVESTWRLLEDKYERTHEMEPTCLAKGVITFSEVHNLLHPRLEDYSEDEFVEMVLQIQLVRPEFELIALGHLLVELIGEETFTRQVDADLDALLGKLHEIGGPAELRRIWLERGGAQSKVIAGGEAMGR